MLRKRVSTSVASRIPSRIPSIPSRTFTECVFLLKVVFPMLRKRVSTSLCTMFQMYRPRRCSSIPSASACPSRMVWGPPASLYPCLAGWLAGSGWLPGCVWLALARYGWQAGWRAGWLGLAGSAGSGWVWLGLASWMAGWLRLPLAASGWLPGFLAGWLALARAGWLWPSRLALLQAHAPPDRQADNVPPRPFTFLEARFPSRISSRNLRIPSRTFTDCIVFLNLHVLLHGTFTDLHGVPVFAFFVYLCFHLHVSLHGSFTYLHGPSRSAVSAFLLFLRCPPDGQ